MVIPIIVGLGAVTAALVGRHLVRNGGCWEEGSREASKQRWIARKDNRHSQSQICMYMSFLSKCTVFVSQ